MRGNPSHLRRGVGRRATLSQKIRSALSSNSVVVTVGGNLCHGIASSLVASSHFLHFFSSPFQSLREVSVLTDLYFQVHVYSFMYDWLHGRLNLSF